MTLIILQEFLQTDKKTNIKRGQNRGTWVAQSVEHPTLDFLILAHDFTVRGFEPHVGLCYDRAKPGDSLTLPLSLCPSPHKNK